MTFCSVRVPTRQHLLEQVPKQARIAELGVFAGDFAADILRICDPSELHLIDRWEGRIACGDQDGRHIVWRDGVELHGTVERRFRRDIRVHLHREDTARGLARFPFQYFDFVYIDADHSYDAVLLDLHAAARVTRLIGGHDYSPQFPGVIDAVRTFLVDTPTGSWKMLTLTDDGCPSYLISCL